ncbi:putative transcription factor C3H family [Helianthus annuus]|nr:putative transcription factor C3H family [Helianthus annuus]KAJ0632961.1 putative transcription factor C3H family [Helianthus annuus]KAJ0813786.1 putative transcription factor C3H family [Helianthus annuus]KAJ0826976.1 putative transcription factor C3H family [Helianthus annuus]
MDGEQDHNFQSAHQLSLHTRKYQSFRNLDIPPRKLLTRRLAALSSEPSFDMYQSPRVLSEESMFHKFLPNSCVDDDSDPYASDEFRMFEFKVRKCTRSRSHDWTDCPFAHPGEKARRRCPRRFCYSGVMCPDFRRGCCVRGDTCEFSHGVFEYWLHPSRYRTEACKDGRSCMRKICFFAHTSSQLRSVSVSEMLVPPNKHCAYCRCHRAIHHTVSPTSVLDENKVSPPSSPQVSPAQHTGGYSPISRFQVESSTAMTTQLGNAGSSCFQVESSSGMTLLGNAGSSYKEVMTPGAMKELMYNMNTMTLNEVDQTPNSNPEWVDSFAAYNDDQRLFCSPYPSTSSPSASGSSWVPPGDSNYAMNNLDEDTFVSETAIARPDLEWVNDLLT